VLREINRDREPVLKPWTVALIPIHILKEHEEINEEHFRELLKTIVNDKVLKMPILVDFKTLIILDGHHKVAVLKALEAKVTPAFLADYSSNNVQVSSWRNGFKVDKNLVIKAGLSGVKLPFKTSKHILRGIKIPPVNIPLEALGVNLNYEV